MKKHLPDIDKLFKKAIDEHLEAPPALVWEAIEKKLDQEKVADISRKYVHLKRAVAILLILLLGAGVYTIKTWKSVHTTKENTEITNNKNGNKTRAESSVTTGSTGKKPGAASIENNKIPVKETGHLPGRNSTSGNPVNQQAANSKPGKSNAATENVLQTAGPDLPVSGHPTIIDPNEDKKIIDKDGTYTEAYDDPLNHQPLNKQPSLASGQIKMQIFTPQLISILPGTAKPIIADKLNLPDYLRERFAPPAKAATKKISPFMLTALAASNSTSNHIEDDKENNRPGRPNNEERDRIKHGENHQGGFTVGLLLDYNVSKHWVLQSGAMISDNTIQIGPKTIYAAADNGGAVKYLYNCASGYAFLSSKSTTSPAIGDSLQALASTNNLQYISVPLAIKYNYQFNRIGLFATAGTSMNILTKGKITTATANGQSKEMQNNKLEGLKSTYLGAAISFGASYNITHKVAIVFVPSYNFALTSGTAGGPVRTYPKALGLAAGLSYKF